MHDLIVDFVSDRTDMKENDRTDELSGAPSSMRDLIVDFKHRRSSYRDINKAEDVLDVTAWFNSFVKRVFRVETKGCKSESSQVQEVEVADDGLHCSLTEYFSSNQSWTEEDPSQTTIFGR